VVPHQCEKTGEIATLAESIRNMREIVEGHNRTLYNGGSNGLKDRMTKVEQKSITHGIWIDHEIASREKDRRDRKTFIWGAASAIVLQVLTLIATVILAMMATGCTTWSAVIELPDGTRASARQTYVLQDKNQSMTYDPATGAFVVAAVNSSDPAVEAFKDGLAAGMGAMK